MGTQLVLFISAGAAAWYILFRTQLGLRIRRRFQAGAQSAAESERDVPGTEPSEDYAFLLERCKGNEAEVLRRLEVETRKNPNLTEAETYRRAIRSWFVEKRGGTHGSIAEELDDTWL
jgi:hypothetical protein